MKSKNNPYWYKLIKLLKGKGIIETGLTIPYVMGAYEVLDQPLQNIDELIKKLVEEEIDKYPVIQKCIKIKQDVIMVEEKHICNKWDRDVKFESKSRKNKLFISTTTNLGTTIDTVASKLIGLYGNQIKDKTYSWDNEHKQWIKFSEEEVNLILSIK